MGTWAWFLPLAAAQGAMTTIDELYFHRRRGLPRWERIGHPIDTLSFLACLAWAAAGLLGNASGITAYVALSGFSCLLITKDEWLHAERCSPGEHWVHSILFVLHPILLGGVGWLGRESALEGPDATAASLILGLEGLSVALFLAYQVVYWRGYRAVHGPGSARPAAMAPERLVS